MKKFIAIFAVALFAVACAGNQAAKPAEETVVVEEAAAVVDSAAAVVVDSAAVAAPATEAVAQ
jgi:PBP1b-binding outer membrane lipoprotein LpoB